MSRSRQAIVKDLSTQSLPGGPRKALTLVNPVMKEDMAFSVNRRAHFETSYNEARVYG